MLIGQGLKSSWRYLFRSLTRLQAWLVRHSASLTESEWDSWQTLPTWPQVPNSGNSTTEIRRWKEMCSGEVSTGRNNTPDADDKDSDLFVSDINLLSEIWANRQDRDHSTSESELANQLATEHDAEGENEDDAGTPLFKLWAQFTDQRPIFQQKCHKTEEQPRKRHKADVAPAHETEQPSRKCHKADVARDYKPEERRNKRHKADIARDHKVPSLNVPLHPSPDSRNSADDTHYQELELDLMNKARHKTQTVDELLEDFLVKLKLTSSHVWQRFDNQTLLLRLDVPSILVGLHRVQNHIADEPGWSPNQIRVEDIRFSTPYFYRLRYEIPVLQQLGTGLTRWYGTSTITTRSKVDNPDVEKLLRWKLNSLLDEVWFITDKGWAIEVANNFDAYICRLSGLTDSKFKLLPECLVRYRRLFWHPDRSRVCKTCNRTMSSRYHLVVHYQRGCRGACSRCDELGLACHEWTCKPRENRG